MTGRGVWVYAVAATIRREWFGAADGVSGRPVWAVIGNGGPAAGGLAAAVSGVSLAEFGAGAVARNLQDHPWRENTTRAHRHVAEIIARHQPVVPVPLATVYPDEAAVVRVLAARQAQFTAALLNVAAPADIPAAADITRSGSTPAAG